jgi:methylmalonyl-CoA mutase
LKTEENLFGNFSFAGAGDWLAAVHNEGAGELHWEPEPGIRVPSLVQPDGSTPDTRLASAWRTGASWLNIPRIPVKDVRTANLLALKYLELGAQGIWFELSVECSAAELLQGIRIDYCYLALSCDPGTEGRLPKLLHQLEGGPSPKGFIAAPGIRYEDPIWERFPGLKACYIPVRGEPASSALSRALAEGANRLAEGIRPENIVFAADAGNEFFAEVGKLKALRYLWHQVCRSSGLSESASRQSWIHAVTRPFTSAAYEPRGHMIAATTAALSAILGGCDALTVLPPDEDSLAQRVALNVSNLLREESYIDKVQDPLLGASALDDYVDLLSRKAWAGFQALMK